ncbi:FAD-dependent oxidoreductase [Bdellovibrio sp. ArHS]|uniref:FAD-dependent oxidoreductase n=1 Tax=Bdellovibrio sp. ArHS TaxID=1569284 RepID=UPI000A754EB8|nr:FAD-dependent oxidoreductase [Bdellovibrio sp. ArHS]
MAKSSFTRRDFLKVSALGTSALALGSCTSLDRYFMGDRRNFKNEVIILGAGAAGLAAAFELKKRKIPFRIFEASSRIGGRVQTVSVFPEGGPVAELGAEFFDITHSRVFELAKELNIPVNEIKASAGVEAHLFAFDKKVYSVKDLASRIKTLQGPFKRIRSELYRDQDVILTYRNAFQFERAAYYDSLSLAELLESWRSEVDPLILKLIEVQAESRFGVDAKDQSALHFLSTLDAEGSSLLTSRPVFRMEGGLSSLMQSLSARVAGVIPDYVVRMNSPLVEVLEDDGAFQLTFQTPEGKEVFTTRHVICTLPFSKLREVSGIQNLHFSQVKKESILTQAYATHAKGTLGFESAFWRQRRGSVPANLGNFTGNFLTEKIWDSGRAQKGSQGLLTFQRSGTSGLQAGAQAGAEALTDLDIFYNGLPAVQPGTAEVANWQQRKWAMGSMAVFKPGQYMRYKGAAGEAEYGGRFQFAGEHTSIRFAGTLHGALESGIKAAMEIHTQI